MLISSLLLVLGGAYMPYTAAAQSSCWRNTPCSGQAEPSFSGAWEQYNLSPSTRTVSPIQILNPDNTFLSKYPGPATLKGNGSLLIFDFGQEVGGIVTVTYNATGTGALGLAFTESKNWTGVASDDSNGSFGPDGALTTNVTSTEKGSYTMPDNKLRGGFRYLTLFTTTNSSISVGILSITLEISFQPAWSNLRAYGGYFSSNDDLINRIWYAGAYTLQTNAISPNSGRRYPLVATGWENDAYLGTNGTSTFVDGSKRDRAVWAGDLCVAVPSILVSIGDSDGVKNAMQTQYDYQQSDGNLPMVGPPINFYDSDTYHMSTMIATYDYILHSNDITFLTGIWTRYKLAMTYVVDKIDSTGLFNCTGTGDWGRYAQGGHNSEANMLMYQTLITGSSIAGWAGEPDLSSTWTSLAATLKSAVNTANWDPAVGAFKDSDIDASVHPEDGNSMALLFNVAASPTYTQSISKQLTTNWNSIGAVCPELPNNIVGYVESFEVKGHLAARQATRALDLMRLSWGWYLNNPEGTGTSTPEGYLADGTFGYRATTGYNNDYSYTSHAHGWSTGPTHALTYYVVGLQLVAPAGSEWVLAPQFGDLTNAEGGFTTPLGLFSASWLLSDGGYSLSYDMPDSSSGTLILPASDTAVLKVDGVVKEGDYNATTELITISGEGGEHNITLTY